MPDPIVYAAPSPSDTVAALAQWLSSQAQEAISDHGVFLLALSGGSTPRQLYSYLAQPRLQKEWDWSRTEIFFSDERDVPPTHPDSNFKMASESLLTHLDPPPQAVHRWQTEYAPALALADYRHQLTMGNTISLPPSLDVVLLGLGPEGHTASLFPGQPVLGSDDIVSHVYVPTHQSWRYTFTLPLLNNSRRVAFLVTGSGKSEIISQIFNSHLHVPASLIQPNRGQVHWFLDSASAAQLNSDILQP